MSICSRCGNPIEFRFIHGKCVPLHLNGDCNRSSTRYKTDFSGYQVSKESTCFATSCPKCLEQVFFIKHNGGSVWLEPPLGPPWFKHGCFVEAKDSSHSSLNLVDDYSVKSRFSKALSGDLLLIGVVKSTNVDQSKKFTKIIFEFGESEYFDVKLKHNAGFLLGKLCVLNSKLNEIWPLDDPMYVFSVYTKGDQLKGSCPICGVKLHPKNIFRHLKKHGVTEGELAAEAKRLNNNN